MTMGRTIRKSSATFGLYFACIALCYAVLAQENDKVKKDELRFAPPKGELGGKASFNCSLATLSDKNATVEFLFKGEPLAKNRTKLTEHKQTNENERDSDGSMVKVTTFNLTLADVTFDDEGDYVCRVTMGEVVLNQTRSLDLRFKGRLLNNTVGPLKPRLSGTDRVKLDMYCLFEVYVKPPNDLPEVRWFKKSAKSEEEMLTLPSTNRVGLRQINSSLTYSFTAEDSGTYVCEVNDTVTHANIRSETEVVVYAPPKIVALNVIPINTTELYISWDVHNYNSPVEKYHVFTREGSNGSQATGGDWVFRPVIGESGNNSYVVEGLKKATNYLLRLDVKTKSWNETGSKVFENWTRTLDQEPVFVPNISIKGFSATSVTIGWPPPPEDIAHLIHYYILEGRKKNAVEDPMKACHPRDDNNLPFMFGNLDPHSTYIFQVRACSEYSKRCGNWSNTMEAATLDGIPGKPSNVLVSCGRDSVSGRGVMNLTWDPPEKPNAEIKGYFMELIGNTSYKDRNGLWKSDSWGPLSRFTTNDSRSARFDELQPNSKFTVRLSAMTRTRRRGDEHVAECRTPAAPPVLPLRPRWRKILESNRYMFKMYLPRMSERNGPICCYRVHMVRMLPDTEWKNLPPPKDLSIIDYEDAHDPLEPILGAYITDIFSNDKFPPESEVVVGDKRSAFNASHLQLTDPTLLRAACRRCLQLAPPATPAPATPAPAAPTTPAPPTTTGDGDDDDVVTGLPEEDRRRRSVVSLLLGEDYLIDVEDSAGVEPDIPARSRRSAESNYNSNPIMKDKTEEITVRVNDGYLDSKSNYTMFVELIPDMGDDGVLLPAVYSDYVNTLMPAPSPPVPVPSTVLELALQVTCAIAAVVLLAMIVFCVMQTRRSRKLPPHAPVEMNRIQQALRYVVGHIGGRQQLLSTVPPDMPPIAKEDLAAAYAERQVDSDYGFQKEFELLQMLPDCYPDRTTHASEARENQPKNRYPDIKAYDQTRVKLSQIDSIAGSDYINANYVMGYRERKQFICAQGPTDTTVNDFWRMIWEHGLELIVMLTNLEEYSKVKCSKYWPDEVRGARAFGAVTVHHVSEKRYSDYIVRELRITKQPTNAEGQPIVENNGVAKRNGDCKEASDSSAPTSPREGKEGEGRVVRQYHFLMWKDFAAPEHPHSILKFIKRVNEAWAGVVTRPLVVHCSAGVGRTGTLVALDCLLEQLRATGHAAVFNTVAELRRQRNFLVQSLKQYVFVYRALVEWAHYGDTEIPASRLKAAVDRLRSTPEGQDKCLMEHEFEKMMTSPVAEPVKSCAAGAGEEVRNRNRSADCLPYDRNRVILTPLPGRDFSTYINASFIEAYDNSEGFIITQDPLPNTIMDFWRMVSEHNVSTIVMLSEIGEGKCPRYWDDGTAQYEHISVQYEESESCPYYTRRQFRVTNNKNGETSSVRQLQYQGWPTAPGHVPEVTRGLADLADAARLHRTHDRTMLVHCHLGTERSALFVALCILIYQLRVERRVDVNVVARKVRSQRARTIDTILQYEFLHRAILNYAELHNLLEDS